MFTGIIRSVGKVAGLEMEGTTMRARIESEISVSFQIDQSVSHNGVCLTITSCDATSHTVDVVRETISKTTFSSIRPGAPVNLETSVTPSTLMDGHIVQGHVDTILQCLDRQDLNGSWKYTFDLPAHYAHLVIPRGSICLHGISLTVASLNGHSFDVAIIPYTFQHTNFHTIQPGDFVNAEFDVIGKYLERFREVGGKS